MRPFYKQFFLKESLALLAALLTAWFGYSWTGNFVITGFLIAIADDIAYRIPDFFVNEINE